jgi:hypothetical protein
MSELLDLLDAGPMIALAIACVLMVSVVVVVVLQARRISRLERQLAERGESAEDAPLRRIAELQARHETSESGTPSSVALRPALVVAGVALVMVLAVGGAWMFLTGGDDGAGASPQAEATGRTATGGGNAATTAPDPVAATTVPASVPPIADTSQFSVAVFNASGVAGAAGDGVTPRLQTEGYQVPITANYPNEETGLQQSVVMYNGSENQAAAWNVARVLGIDRTPPLEGLTVDQIGGADVVVVVGLDIAESVVSTETP